MASSVALESDFLNPPHVALQHCLCVIAVPYFFKQFLQILVISDRARNHGIVAANREVDVRLHPNLRTNLLQHHPSKTGHVLLVPGLRVIR